MTVKRYGTGLNGRIEEMECGAFTGYAEYSALLKERDALAVENVGLKGALNKISFTYQLSPHIHEMTTIKTPATDAAIANLQAQGVDKLATFAGKEYQRFVGDKTLQRKWKGIVLLCTDFAAQLRKEPAHD